MNVAGTYMLLTGSRPLRVAQGRKALEGKTELEVAFNSFSTVGLGKTGRQHSKQG